MVRWKSTYVKPCTAFPSLRYRSMSKSRNEKEQQRTPPLHRIFLRCTVRGGWYIVKSPGQMLHTQYNRNEEEHTSNMATALDSIALSNSPARARASMHLHKWCLFRQCGAHLEGRLTRVCRGRKCPPPRPRHHQTCWRRTDIQDPCETWLSNQTDAHSWSNPHLRLIHHVQETEEWHVACSKTSDQPIVAPQFNVHDLHSNSKA